LPPQLMCSGLIWAGHNLKLPGGLTKRSRK
jgi:hypothetical protein